MTFPFVPSRRGWLRRAAGGALGASLAAASLGIRAQKLEVIRFGVSAAPVGNPPVSAGNAGSIAHWKGWLDEEFRKDGTRIEWFFFRGAGPAVNEALINRQLDFAFQGDLPAILARASGLKTRLLMSSGSRNNLYVAVPPDSGLQSIAQLRGQRVALFKGTSGQLPTNRLLEKNGLTEKDLKAYNLDYASMQTALATRDIDAAFGGIELLKLREQGVAKILYTSRDDSPIFTRQNHVLVTDGFEKSRPDAVQRVVDVLVRSARWGSDQNNREDVLRQWSKAGTPYEAWREDLLGQPLKVRLAPEFDPLLVWLYKDASRQLVKYKLARREVDVDGWIERKYLGRALKAQQLENFWPRLDPQGRQTVA